MSADGRAAAVASLVPAWGFAWHLLDAKLLTLQELATLGPLATTLAAFMALVVGVMTIRQRKLADKRDQWWKRVQWALDQAASEDSQVSAMGFSVLTALVEDKTASSTDAAMLENATTSLNSRLSQVNDESATIVVTTS